MFIVWGSRARTKVIEKGEFYCPDCQGMRPYEKKEVKSWFTLYWIPLFPTKTLGQYIECADCKATFNVRVLDYNPEAVAQKIEAEFAVAAKRVMFKMALADGEIDDSEIAVITQAFSNITKREIDQGDISAEIEAARHDAGTVEDYLRDLRGSLNDSGKETVLRSAIAVAKADGVVDDDEKALMARLGQALELPPAYAKGILAEEGVL